MIRSCVRVLRQQLTYPCLEALRGGHARLEEGELLSLVLGEHVLGVALVGRTTCGELPRHAAQCIQVGPRADSLGLATDLFGCHIGGGTGDTGSKVAADGPGQAEVGELQTAAAAEHVGRLEVPVDHAAGMSMGESGQHLQQDVLHVAVVPRGAAGDGPVGGELQRHPPGARKQLAFHFVGHEAGVVHLDDAGVGEGGHRLDLPLQGPRCSAALGSEHLHGHRPSRGVVEGPIHQGMGALADGFGEPKGSELRRRGRHRYLLNQAWSVAPGQVRRSPHGWSG